MDKSKLDKPLQCNGCGAEFLIKRFRSQLPMIIKYCRLQNLKHELFLLSKVEEMYNKYPESINKMPPDRFYGNNYLPTNEEITKWTNGNTELAQFLLSNSFDLDGRRTFLVGHIETFQMVEPTKCPLCESGIICFKEGRLFEFIPKLT